MPLRHIYSTETELPRYEESTTDVYDAWRPIRLAYLFPNLPLFLSFCLSVFCLSFSATLCEPPPPRPAWNQPDSPVGGLADLLEGFALLRPFLQNAVELLVDLCGGRGAGIDCGLDGIVLMLSGGGVYTCRSNMRECRRRTDRSCVCFRSFLCFFQIKKEATTAHDENNLLPGQRTREYPKRPVLNSILLSVWYVERNEIIGRTRRCVSCGSSILARPGRM